MANYQAVTDQAKSVAATPYTGFDGQLVAPVNGQQTTGINAVNDASGIQNPYNAGATGLAAASSGTIDPTKFSAAQLQQYENPYQNDVINATMAEINNQNQQQAAALQGNAVSAGAFGGDRAGVAQAALAGQQDIANNATLAGLNSQNFTNAMGEFNTQQGVGLSAAQNTAARQLAASQQIGNLGQTAQTEALAGANAQVNAGTLEQQTQQAQDTAAYNQFLQKQAYPFQTTGWLANIVEGIGSQSGGTSTGQTTTQGGSGASSVVGGLLGLASFLNRGGRVNEIRVPHKAGGGALLPYDAVVPQGLGSGSYVTPAGLAVGHTMPTGGMPTAPAAPNAGQNMAQAAKGVQGLGNAFNNSAIGDSFNDFMQDSGGIGGLLGFASGGSVRPHFDGGGDVSPDALWADADNPHGTGPTLQPNDLTPVERAALAEKYANQMPTPQQLAPAAALASPVVDATSSVPLPAPRPTGLGASVQPASFTPYARGLAVPTQSGDNAYGEPTSPAANTTGLNPSFADKVQDLQQDAGDQGIPSTLISGRRDPELQAKLYANYQARKAGEPLPYPSVGSGGLAAPPGTSRHETGNAADIIANNPSQQAGLIAISKEPWRGLTNLAGLGDSPHFQSSGPPGVAPSDPRAINAYATAPNAATAHAGARPGGLGSYAPLTTDSPVASTDVNPDAPAPGATQAQEIRSDSGGGLLGLHLSPEVRQGLLAAGLGAMGGTSMNPWINIGQGGEKGLGAYNNARNLQSEIDLRRAQAERQMVETGLLPAKTASEIAEQQARAGLFGGQAAGADVEAKMKKAQLDLMLGILGGHAATGDKKADAIAANPSGVTAPTVTAPTVARNGPAPAQPAQKTVDPRSDPNALRAEADRISLGGPMFKERADRMYTQAAAIMNGEQQVQFTDGTTGYYPGIGEAKAAQAAAVKNAEVAPTIATHAGEKNFDVQNQYLTTAANEAENGQNMKTQALALRNLMFDPKTGKPLVNSGPYGEKLAGIAATMKQLGIGDHLISALTGTDPNNAQAIEKLRTSLGSEAARADLANSQVRVAEFQRFLASTPNASLLPEAYKFIIDKAILPKAEQQIQEYESVKGLDPTKDDVRGKLFEYRQSHPWYAGAPPADPNDRVKNTIYANPAGARARWTGTGWAPVQ